MKNQAVDAQLEAEESLKHAASAEKRETDICQLF